MLVLQDVNRSCPHFAFTKKNDPCHNMIGYLKGSSINVARNSSADETSKGSNVIWLSDATPQDLPLIGLKALNLGIIQRLKLPVPPAFCITTQAYRRCLESFGISLDESLNLGFQETLQMGRLIQHSFFKYPLPVDVLSDIRNAHRQLTQQQEMAVVLRPSLPYASPLFSRRLRPLLNIRGMIEFEKALKVCWAYIWLDEVIAYRFSQSQLTKRLDDLAIVVQPFIKPRTSGSLITFNPANNSDQEIVIESAWGLNEAVARGLIVPDQFVWQRFLKKSSRQQIACKTSFFELAEEGSIKESPVDARLQKYPSLNESDLQMLSDFAEKAVAGYQRPVELEWIKTEKGFQFIQAHALPVPAAPIAQESEWERLDTVATYFQQPFSPLGWSFLEPLLEQALQAVAEYLGVGGLPSPAFRLINYSIHWHPSIPRLFQHALSSFSDSLQAQNQIKSQWQVFWGLFKAQNYWQGLYNDYVQEMRVFWEQDPAAGEPEQLLESLEHLSEVVLSFFEAALLVRCLSGASQNLISGLVQTYFQEQENPPVYDILFKGLPGRRAESLQVMDQTVEKIRSDPKLLSLFKLQTTAALWEQLQLQESGAAFLESLKQDFGVNGYFRTGLDPLYPSWVDTPQAILQELQQAIQHQRIFWDERIFIQREELSELIFQTVGPWRLPDILFLRMALHLGQSCVQTAEDEPFYLSMFAPVLRRIMGGLSRFLPLESQFDIFYLELPEIRNLLQAPMNAFRIKELKELIQARKYERKIGNRLGGKQKLESLELQGLSANGGQYLGKARIILRSEDLKELRQGEILVTDYFEPAWEQALTKAGALLMELGGILSHGAQLARQYKLPAVVGLPKITQELKTGYVLRVDGSTGQVSAYQAMALEKQEDFVG
jgi:rifampicin phosphotransferase